MLNEDALNQISSPEDQFVNRRRFDMRKRLVELNYRRDRLERELNAVNSALFLLNREIEIHQRALEFS